MGKWLRTIGWLTIVIGATIGALRATVMRWWWVPTDDATLGASMAPSLFPGDLVLLWHHQPKFGDLARCADPEAPGRYVVGRIVGEPGDRLDFTQDNVSVNGKRNVYESSCAGDKMTIQDPTSGADVEVHCNIEVLIGHKYMRVTNARSQSMSERHVEVGPGQFYLLSDNRAFPFDSRQYGGLPKSSCQDQVFFRIQGRKGLSDEETRFMVIQ